MDKKGEQLFRRTCNNWLVNITKVSIQLTLVKEFMSKYMKVFNAWKILPMLHKYPSSCLILAYLKKVNTQVYKCKVFSYQF